MIGLILCISVRIAISNGLWSPGAGIIRMNEGIMQNFSLKLLDIKRF